MNLRELIDNMREEIGDIEAPYLISDTLATRYANKAEMMASRQARLLVETIEMPVSAGEPTVEIDPGVISIRRAVITGRSNPLTLAKVRDMDERFPGWNTSGASSIPMILITDYESGSLRLYPAPKDDATLYVTVTREPKSPMADDEDEPEIPRRYHEGLVAGMCWMALLKQDTDLYDKDIAKQALDEFVAEFGPVISAVDERYEFENYHDIGER